MATSFQNKSPPCCLSFTPIINFRANPTDWTFSVHLKTSHGPPLPHLLLSMWDNDHIWMTHNLVWYSCFSVFLVYFSDSQHPSKYKSNRVTLLESSPVHPIGEGGIPTLGFRTWLMVRHRTPSIGRMSLSHSLGEGDTACHMWPTWGLRSETGGGQALWCQDCGDPWFPRRM